MATTILVPSQPSWAVAHPAWWGRRTRTPLQGRSFSKNATTTTTNTTTSSSFGVGNDDTKKKVEPPFLSAAEVGFIQDMWRKLVGVVVDNENNINDGGVAAKNDTLASWNNATQITSALLQLRTKWITARRKEDHVDGSGDSDVDARSRKLQALFDRVFAPNQFGVVRLDDHDSVDDAAKRALLVDLLARDRVHPMKQQQQQQQRHDMIQSMIIDDDTKHVYSLLHTWSGRPAMLLRVSLSSGPDIPSCLDQIFRRRVDDDDDDGEDGANQKEGAIASVTTADTTTITTSTTKTKRTRNVATFYSISLLEEGWSGLGLGERFLHAAMEILQRQYGVDTFVTLSPLPRFREWRMRHGSSGGDHGQHDNNNNCSSTTKDHQNNNNNDPDEQQQQKQQHLVRLLHQDAYRYLVQTKDRRGLPYDPVARFHLSNGAQLYRINYHPSNLSDSYGVMVNYRYNLARLTERKAAFPERLAVHEEVGRHCHLAR